MVRWWERDEIPEERGDGIPGGTWLRRSHILVAKWMFWDVLGFAAP
jgi:hypothetical protein